MTRRRTRLIASLLAVGLALPAPTASATEPPPATDPVATATPKPNADASPTLAPETPPATAAPEADSLSDGTSAAEAASRSPSGPESSRGADPTPARYIVVLRNGVNVPKAAERARSMAGARAERLFTHVIDGYVTQLSDEQRRHLEADPSVALIVPDERIEKAAQTIPTGVSRIDTPASSLAAIDGVDTRIDADVAVVDTGIDATHPDLNVAGGYNCSTADRSAWRDVDAHGTHVAGTIGALDNGIGVVGVAPGVRLWAVKILNDEGWGHLSWYICGLDWIASRRDPRDPARPFFEAVNMSVAKSGRDDGNCGFSNSDVLHQAICRLVKSGVSVAAAAANSSTDAGGYVPAAYNEVITVSALADTDGTAGGSGGPRCYSWGTYDQDDTFADFSNYGADIDLIAPGKCIWSTLPGRRYGYSSGTSMATPHVAGAIALYKASRLKATPAEVRRALQYLGSTSWIQSSDPDGSHERFVRIDGIGALGDYTLVIGSYAQPVGTAGAVISLPLTVGRSSTFFEEVRLTLTSVPAPLSAALSTSALFGYRATSATLTVTVPPSTPAGRYTIAVQGSNLGRVRKASVTILVETPTATAPARAFALGGTLTSGAIPVKLTWSGTAGTSGVARYELRQQTNGGAWTTVSSSLTATSLTRGLAPGHTYRFAVRAVDNAGNVGAFAYGAPFTLTGYQQNASATRYSGTWRTSSASYLWGGSAAYSSIAGATASFSFTGRSFALVASRGPTRGKARIYVNGIHATTIDLYAASSQHRRVVWAADWSTAVTRTITVRVSGTGGRPTVVLDGFAVVR